MTQVNKTQVKDLSLYDHHVAEAAEIAWTKISKVGAIPPDIGAEWALIFSSPLVRTVSGITNTISIDLVALITALSPITVNHGGTGITSVPAGQVLFGSTDTALNSVSSFLYDVSTSSLKLESIKASGTRTDHLIEIKNKGTGSDLLSYKGLGSVELSLYKTTSSLTPFDTVTKVAKLFSLNDGYITLTNSTGTGFSGINFGGSSAVFPLLKVNTTNLEFRLGNDSDYTSIFAKNLTLSGDLTVNGTTTTLNSQTLSVTDPLIYLANTNVANTMDIGFVGKYISSAITKYTGLYKSNANDKYYLFTGLTAFSPLTDFTVNRAGAGYTKGILVADLEGNSFTATDGLTSASGTLPLRLSLVSKGLTGSVDVFTASGAGHASGVVPDPGAVIGTTKFLCEDGQWKSAVAPVEGARTVTSNGAVNATTDTFILIDATSGELFITLPKISSCNSGKIFYFKKIDASITNYINITAYSGDFIDSASDPVMIMTKPKSAFGIVRPDSGNVWRVF